MCQVNANNNNMSKPCQLLILSLIMVGLGVLTAMQFQMVAYEVTGSKEQSTSAGMLGGAIGFFAPLWESASRGLLFTNDDQQQEPLLGLDNTVVATPPSSINRV